MFLVFCLFIQACTYDKTTVASQPNFIFIIADDLNDAIGSYGGHDQSYTPFLDQLAKQGVQFSNAHVNSPICGPSRASLLKGIYPHRSGYYGYNFIEDHWKNNPILKNATDFIELFQGTGYKTLGTGKIYHNNQEDWRFWDEFGIMPDWGPWAWDGDTIPKYEHGTLSPWRNAVPHPDIFPNQLGIDGQFGSLERIPMVAPDTLKHTPGNTGWRLFYKDFKYNEVNDRDLLPDELNANWAREKLREKHEKPFLLMIGINRPHSPMFAPQEFYDLHPLEEIKTTRIKNDDLNDVAQTLSSAPTYSTEDYGFHKYRTLLELGGDAMLKKWTQAYLANVSFVDTQIGKILNALKESDYSENTYVIFTSDNGYHMGEKNMLFKNTLWEESTRVPFLIAGPGVIKERVTETPVSLIDLYPTLVDLAKISLPDSVNLDGHSLRPLLEESENEWRGLDFAITSVASNDSLKLGEPGVWSRQHHAIRTNEYRYIYCNNGEEELYDHKNDPYEWKNLAKDSSHFTVTKTLYKKILNLLSK